ncbi:MAG: hypothetical protein LBM68_05765 [Bacteroidales bacterium]|nr:hypothetical protein [Bacteroidales bacterium]
MQGKQKYIDMETLTPTKSKNYCFPQDKPATKEELSKHIKNAMSTGYSLTYEEHEQKMAEFMKKL